MDAWVGHLHNRYQFFGASNDLSAAARLNELLRAQVLEMYAQTMGRLLNGDESVYVLRRVQSRLTLRLENGQIDHRLVEQWSRQMALAVIRQILDGDGVVRFENQADYLAHFLMDLLDGRAWTGHLYGPFRALRSLPPAKAAGAALRENAPLLAQVLARLYRMQALEPVLAAMEETDRGELWAVLAPPPGGELSAPRQAFVELARPFCAAAFTLAGRLEMWARPQPRLENWAAGLAGVWQPPDWRDPRALALALRDVLRLLAEQGYLRRPAGATLSAGALDGLDWLDLETFRQAFFDLLESSVLAPWHSGPARQGVTPRQGQLLDDLLTVLENGVRLDVRRPDSAENGLRLLGRLAGEHPEWSGDPLAARLVAILLAAWNLLAQARRDHQAALLSALRHGNLAAAEQILPGRMAAQAAERFQPVVALGERAARVLAALSAAGPSAEGPAIVEDEAGWVESPGLGTALLLRAVLDARLSALLARSGYPDPALPLEIRLPALVLALLLHWSGAGNQLSPLEDLTAGEEPIDPALRMLVGAWGSDLPLRTRAELLAVWPAAGLTSAGQLSAVTFLEEAAGQLEGLGLEGAGQAVAEFLSPYTSADGGEASPPVDAVVGLLGGLLLRLWARWLRNFSRSSPEYLRTHWIDRQGRVSIDAHSVRVELQARPLDVVLEMAGYLSPLERLPWLAGRMVTFRTESF